MVRPARVRPLPGHAGEAGQGPDRRGRPLGGPIGFGRALLRNTAKIALPWELGHTVAYGFATAAPNPPGSLLVLTIIVYVIMFAWLGALFLPSGRTPYDLLSGTRVVRPQAP